MSRSRNLKRAKALHQKKVLNRQGYKIAEQHFDHPDHYEDDFMDDAVVIDRALIGSEYKVSALVIEMVQPMLDEANDLEEIREILVMGIIAWNCGILRDTGFEAELSEVFRKLKARKYRYERKLLDEYIDIKCTKFKAYNDFIIGHEFSADEGKFKFTVTTPADDKIIEDFLKEDWFIKFKSQGV